MKIEIPSGGNAVSTLKGVVTGPAQSNGTDFKSTFTSAVAASTERGDKAPQAKDAKSSAETSKRKDASAETSTASVHTADVPVAKPVTLNVADQSLPEASTTASPDATALLASTFVAPAFVASANDQTTSALPTTTGVNNAIVAKSQAVASGSAPSKPTLPVGSYIGSTASPAVQQVNTVINDRVASAVPTSSSEAIVAAPQAIASESVPSTSNVPAAADLDSTLSTVVAPVSSDQTAPTFPAVDTLTNGPATDASNKQAVLSSIDTATPATLLPASAPVAKAVSDATNKSLALSGVAVSKAASQEVKSTASTASLVSHLSAETASSKQASPDVSAKAIQSVDTTAKRQDAVQTTVQRSSTDDFKTTGAADAAAQARNTEQANGSSSTSFPALTSATNVQGTAASNLVTAQNTIFGSTLTGKESTSGLATSGIGSSVKGKDSSSDLRTKRSDDAASDSDSPSVSAGASFVAKVSEASANTGQDANSQAGTADKTAVQMALTTNQTATPDHAQQASQGAATVASTVAHTQGTAGTATDLQAASGVNSAQLTQSMHHSEMRLGMQSAEFGDISISTSINHQALSAQISIDHFELGKALAVHLPAIEAKLGSAYGLEARVEVRDGGSASPSYSNSGQQSRERSQSQNGSSALQTSSAARMSALNESTTASVAASTSRLDIRI